MSPINSERKNLRNGFEAVAKFGNDQSIDGHISVNGDETYFRLLSNQPINLQSDDLIGQLEDGRTISLLKCIRISKSFPSKVQMEQEVWGSYKEIFFPNLIIIGENLVDRSHTRILSVNFRVPDLDDIFYDFGITGSVWHGKEALRTLRKTGFLKHHRMPDFKSNSIIHFWTGKKHVFEIQTHIGKVSSFHNISHTFLVGPEGYQLSNTPTMRIVFTGDVSIFEAMEHIHVIRQFLQIISGTRQYLSSISMTCKKPGQKKFGVDVFDPNAPDPESISRSRVHPADVLIKGARQPKDFGTVLANWIERAGARQLSRRIFASCHENHNRYDQDRLVAAANIFDLLPESDTTQGQNFSEEARALVDEFKTKVETLSSDEEKKTLRSRSGHLLSTNLKSKIRHRASLIESKFPKKLSGLNRAVDLAVNARNSFVHGSGSRKKKEFYSEHISLLTNVLEFVYATSELIVCGWDPVPWIEGGISANPFGHFLLDFPQIKRILVIENPKT